MVDVNPVVVRALNFLRGAHLPTYVALRLMLNRVPAASLDEYITAIVSQTTIRRSHRILHLRRFKSVAGTEFVYRNYSIPSPTSALADSYAISVLQSSGIIRRRDHVFSYRCPRHRSEARNFEHFSIGYGERNAAIGRALEDERMVAVVVDIRNFYPSVDASHAIERLRSKLHAIPLLSKRDREVVLSSAQRAVAQAPVAQKAGLCVGPDMSHVLADIALEDVDADLVAQFASNYFRYVDDIVVVVKKRDAKAAKEAVSEILARAGYARSEEKDDVVSYADWSGFQSVAASVNSEVSFALSGLKFRSKLFLAKQPLAVDSLRDAMSEAGVFLPVNQLLDGARQRFWQYRVASLFSKEWRVVTRYWRDSLSDVVLAAQECRRIVIDDVERVIAAGTPEGSSLARKWKIQRARIAINRALYFADSSELLRMGSYTSQVPELAETAAVCRALLGDLSLVVRMPGPAVAAFSQVASIRGISFPDLRPLSGATDDEILADVASHFALRSEGFSFESSTLNRDLSGLTSFAMAAQSSRYAASVGGYGAEVSALGINGSRQERTEAASTRFTSKEDVVLDALNLSANYLS